MNENHERWFPENTFLTSVKDVLEEALVPDSEVQKNAREKLGLIQNMPNFTFYLLHILRDPSYPEDIRSLSGVLLKNNLRTTYPMLTPDDASKLKEDCQNLLTDASRDVRLSVSNVIVIIARDDLSDWARILLKVFADQNEFSEVALKTLFEICEDLIENQNSEIGGIVKQVFPKLFECLSINYCSVHQDIVKLTNQCLQDHFDIMKQALDLDLYLRQVISLANTDDTELQKHVCHTFVIYVEKQEESLLPHLHDVIMYIVEKNQHEDAEIALQACEFWLAVSKLDGCKDILTPYLSKLVPTLLKNMRYSSTELNAFKDCLGSDADTKDLAKDIAPFHKNIEDDDFDDFHVGWTLRKCSAASLDSLALQFKNDLLPVIVPFLSEMLNHQDYLVKESGILALGAIAEGCINGLKHQLHDLMQFLQLSMSDEHSLVRVITCWTVSRCTGWIINVGPDAYFVPIMILILKHFSDCNKRVQRAAISAFCIFLEEAQIKVVPYINIIVESFSQGLERFQSRSLYLLYDAIGALAQSVGSNLNEPEYIGKFLPPLMQTFCNFNDSYDEHFVIFLECLANVIPALELSFLPYAEIVFCHCLQVINDTLMCCVNFQENPDEYELPDKESMSVAHDVLYSMAIGLKSHFVKYVTNSNLLFLLYTTCQDSSCSVRQTSIALYGELVTLCYAYLSSNVHDFVPMIIKSLDEKKYAVCNNAAWVIGKLCTAMGSNIQPYLSEILLHFIRILNDQALARNLHQTVAIALCIILLVCPDAIIPTLDVTLKNCCLIIRNVRDSIEKDLAFRGLCETIVRCPDFGKNYFIFFCDAAASWFNINSDLKENIRSLIMSFKNDCGEDRWAQFSSQFPSHLKARLYELYGV
ncbi:unnamed protein product [Ceutorhynchus assimilis]|uniref:Transportin-1 n=1 Tax=Ceutorhynchus assimilis TaxID=467358 RepID=A0A9N9MIE2_9CUCU|nr:unnamed protein product [Ceutorhynchus assimilis]